MNVAIISPEFPPLTNWGGIATFNSNLAKLLHQLGHHVVVFVLDETTKKEYTVNRDGIKIVYIPGNFQNKLLNFLYFLFPFGIIRKLIQKKFAMLLFSFEWNLFSLLSFRTYIKHTPIQSIHTPVYHVPALAIKLCYRYIPLILHAQGPQELLNPFEPRTIDSAIKVNIENFYIQRFATCMVACSKSVQTYLSQKFPPLQDIIVQIPNFIDTQLVNKVPLSYSKNTWLFIGRLEYRKGTDIVVRSFIKNAKKNRSLVLYLIGKEGDTWPAGKTFVSFNTWLDALDIPNSIKQRIVLVNQINNAHNLLSFLQQHRGISILPSRYEPFGFVYLEAMLAGCITLASAVGGGREIISDGTDGFLTQPTVEDVIQHIKVINRLNTARITSTSQAAQQTVRDRFDIGSVKKSYTLLYKNYIRS